MSSFLLFVFLLIHICSCLQTSTSSPTLNTQSTYATYWENILLEEHEDAVADLKEKRKTFSRKRLEQTGISIFGACAEPDSDLLGEKIVRVYKRGETRFRDRFTRGDVLVMTPVVKTLEPKPRECLIVDVGKDWMTLGVGPSWPTGLWESRKLPGFFEVRLDRTAPQAPLRAQRRTLDLLRNGHGGQAAELLACLFTNKNESDDEFRKQTSMPPARFDPTTLRQDIIEAINETKKAAKLNPNRPQEVAIARSLQKRISLIRGPPGTGKTRVAALLISTALRLKEQTTSLDDNNNKRPRVLAVTHSNGAADVLLRALLRIGVPAIRLGRPAAVSADVQHRTAIAMSEKMPQVVQLRQQISNPNLDGHVRSGAAFELRQAIIDAQKMISKSAPVVVTTCIGAYGLLAENQQDENGGFPLVVLDEAAQTTEPALICALVAARAEQFVLVGDTRQLPPTITSMQLRDTLGVSPMSRLEKYGVGASTLRVQYRMPQALLEHPSKYFYKGLVRSARVANQRPLPVGFPWPSSKPLAFMQTGKGDSEILHNMGGRSNSDEAEIATSIVLNLLSANYNKKKQHGTRQKRRRRKRKFGVAVISPYARQVQLIRSKLADAAATTTHGQHQSWLLDEEVVRVGTVDSFQGQETDVVVLSTVRSNPIQELGFLRDSRRLCVAITRARSGLIVVGDKATLRTCRHWSALIESMETRGCAMDAKDYWLASSLPENEANGQSASKSSSVEDAQGEYNDVAGEEELYEFIESTNDDTYGLFSDATSNTTNHTTTSG